MIITVRGTNGAGKSYLVDRLMKKAGETSSRSEIYRKHSEKDRQVIVGYDYVSANTFFVGKYSSGSGGCDVLPHPKGAADWLQVLISEHAAAGRHVVFEGLIASKWKSSRYTALDRVAPLHIIHLNLTVEECAAAVDARRAVAGATGAYNREKQAEVHQQIVRKCAEDAALGLKVYRLDREAAFQFCCEKLDLRGEA